MVIQVLPSEAQRKLEWTANQGEGDGGIEEGWRRGENEVRKQMATTAEQTAPRASQGTPVCNVMRDLTS